MSVSIAAGGAAKTVTVTADGKFKNNLSWAVKNNAGLTVEENGTKSNTSRQYSISAPSNITAGQRIVVIEVSDDVNTETLNINALVTVASNDNKINNNNNTNNNSESNSGVKSDEEKREDFLKNNSDIAKGALSTITNENILSLASFISNIARIASGISKVVALDVDYFSDTSRTVYDIDEDFEDQTPVLALPKLEKGAVTEAAVHVFAIDISAKIQDAKTAKVIGSESRMFVYATKITSENLLGSAGLASVHLSEENSTKGMFLDDNGNELQTADDLLNASNVNIATYLEPDYDYSIVITAASDDNVVIGPSGAGCMGGSALGLIAMTLASGVFYVRKKIKAKK